MNKLKRLVLCLGLLASIYICFPTLSIANDNEDLRKGFESAQKGDFTSALKFWQPLAEKGVAQAQSYLGLMYDSGQGVPQDYKLAVKWYTLAAEKGFAQAQFNLASMYENGQGVPQDYKLAVKFYTLAAEQGEADAQTNLGVMYYSGKGVSQDYIKAYMWMNLAAAIKEDKKTKSNRDTLVNILPAAQIEKAQEYSTRCVEQNYKNCDF